MPVEKSGFRERERRGRRSKKWRHGRFYRSLSVGVLDAKERRKYGRNCGVLLHRKDRGARGSVLSSDDKNGESCKRMNGIGKGKSCKGEGYLLLLLLFVEKQSEGHGYELEEI